MLVLSGGILATGLAGCLSGPQFGAQASTEEGDDEQSHDDDEHDDNGDGHEDDDHADEATPAGHTPGDDEHAHEDAGHAHDEEVADPVDHATVAMITTDEGFHFDPHVTRVTVGGSVTFVNESGSHSAAAYHPDNDRSLRMPEAAAPWDTGLMTEAGAEQEVSFDTEGVYQYYCRPHEGMGMIGALIVGEPDAHGQPGLEPPQDAFSGRAAEKIEELNEMCNEALGHTH